MDIIGWRMWMNIQVIICICLGVRYLVHYSYHGIYPGYDHVCCDPDVFLSGVGQNHPLNNEHLDCDCLYHAGNKQTEISFTNTLFDYLPSQMHPPIIIILSQQGWSIWIYLMICLKSPEFFFHPLPWM